MEADNSKDRVRRGQQLVRNKALWSCNRFLVTRELWKSLFVPTVTYANAVVIMDTHTLNSPDTTQRVVARHALRCRFTCPTQFLEGEFGASSFWARDAQAKVSYEARLRLLLREGVDNVAAEILYAKDMTHIRSSWNRRVQFLKRRYNCEVDVEQHRGNMKVVSRAIKRIINKESEQRWKKEMERKSSLQFYRENKCVYGLDAILYSNSHASGLFADCRAGMLNTNIMKAKYSQVISTKCRLCDKEEETIEHIVIDCDVLGSRTAGLKEALGFTEEKQWKDISETKRRLAIWAAHKKE